jgi:tungstate transport system permease protein
MTWEYVLKGIEGAFEMIASLDVEVADIALRSIKVSGIATLMAAIIGIPTGVALGISTFRGRNVLRSFFNGMLGIPTVVMGLILYLILAPAGPLGSLKLLYTEMGISFGQMLLILPIVVSFTASSIESVEREIRELALTLGASRAEATLKVIREASAGVLLAVIAAFNRAIAELGIALMVGGNIFVRGGALNTRVLTTSIQMYVARGDIDIAIALGMILLGIVFVITTVSNFLQSRWVLK